MNDTFTPSENAAAANCCQRDGIQHYADKACQLLHVMSAADAVNDVCADQSDELTDAVHYEVRERQTAGEALPDEE